LSLLLEQALYQVPAGATQNQQYQQMENHHVREDQPPSSATDGGSLHPSK
jgi:hypothetical protein